MMINKVPVKKLVEFRRLSERRQASFARNLKIPKLPKSDEGDGGDYWIRSMSGLSNAFKYNDNTIVKEKLDSLAKDYEATANKNTKIMYQRNIEILREYEEFDFSTLRPSVELKFLSKPKIVLNIKDIPVQVIPHHLFSFGDKDEPKIGGIWFVTWLEGFKQGDLGIFSEALFRYISLLYSKEYEVDPRYCLIVDSLSNNVVAYSEVLDGKIPSLLRSTVDTLNKYLR